MNTHWKRWILLGLMTASFGIIASNANDVQVQSYIVHADSYQIPYKGKEKEFHHKINPGYGSALVFKDMKRDGTIEFYGITDRRPNGDIPTYLKDGQKKSGKFFPTPEFTPSIGVITVSPTKKRADITQSIPLNVQGKPITGKSLPDGLTGSTNELAVNVPPPTEVRASCFNENSTTAPRNCCGLHSLHRRSRATHGTLCVMSGNYSPSFFSYIYRSVLISVMVTATFRTIPFPYRYVLGCIVLEATNMT